MTVEQAIAEIRQAGSLALAAGGIRYEIRKRGPETATALAILKDRKSEAMALLSPSAEHVTKTEPLEPLLKGRAIELWSDSAGRLFLVADEADALQAMERLGARRGEVYTAAELRRIVAVNDPGVVAEIHEWKRRFDGVVRKFRAGEQPK
jgi:hypothetical protein